MFLQYIITFGPEHAKVSAACLFYKIMLPKMSEKCALLSPFYAPPSAPKIWSTFLAVLRSCRFYGSLRKKLCQRIVHFIFGTKVVNVLRPFRMVMNLNSKAMEINNRPERVACQWQWHTWACRGGMVPLCPWCGWKGREKTVAVGVQTTHTKVMNGRVTVCVSCYYWSYAYVPLAGKMLDEGS
jgi:hypothetical protein